MTRVVCTSINGGGFVAVGPTKPVEDGNLLVPVMSTDGVALTPGRDVIESSLLGATSPSHAVMVALQIPPAAILLIVDESSDYTDEPSPNYAGDRAAFLAAVATREYSRPVAVVVPNDYGYSDVAPEGASPPPGVSCVPSDRFPVASWYSLNLPASLLAEDRICVLVDGSGSMDLDDVQPALGLFLDEQYDEYEIKTFSSERWLRVMADYLLDP